MPKPKDKPFAIPKQMVWEAWLQVMDNDGAPGVDGQDLDEFEADLRNNLYVIWNRMSSGSYCPPPVRAVEIPKPHSPGVRVLGVPTIADRVAQTVVAKYLEPLAEQIPPGLLWLPARKVGSSGDGGLPATVLEVRLAHRLGCPEVLR